MTTKTKEQTLTPESIQERIKDLIEQRDKFIQEANQQIAFYNGSIQVLDGLLSDNGQDEPVKKTAQAERE
jgi:hypothetical protein